jgi:hypothetical protein
VLALICLAATLAAAQAPDKQMVRAVERFVKTDVSDMTPAYIERMMAVDPQAVPPKLRRRLEAKRLELETYKQLGEGKRRGTVRTPEKDCALPKDADNREASVLLLAGFVEIFDPDVAYLQETTHCSQRKMMCEFSLHVVLKTQKKGPPLRRWFLHSKDPLMALVGEFQTKGANSDTKFFGLPKPICSGD